MVTPAAWDERAAQPIGIWAKFAAGMTPGQFVSLGIVAGLGAGIVFILLEMAWLTHLGKPAVTPLLVISTIFNGTNAPTVIPTQIPLDAIVGLVVHLNLSLAFGLGFLPIVALLARLRQTSILTLTAAGLVYGGLLYVLNFVILSKLAWPAFTAPGSPQGFFFWVHVLYGLMLVPFFAGILRRVPSRG